VNNTLLATALGPLVLLACKGTDSKPTPAGPQRAAPSATASTGAARAAASAAPPPAAGARLEIGEFDKPVTIAVPEGFVMSKHQEEVAESKPLSVVVLKRGETEIKLMQSRADLRLDEAVVLQSNATYKDEVVRRDDTAEAWLGIVKQTYNGGKKHGVQVTYEAIRLHKTSGVLCEASLLKSQEAADEAIAICTTLALKS
jgi:hypothetical protein